MGLPGAGFHEVVAKAAVTWEKALEKIHVEGGSDRHKKIFYTALYHVSLKPADFQDENPFAGRTGRFSLIYPLCGMLWIMITRGR